MATSAAANDLGTAAEDLAGGDHFILYVFDQLQKIAAIAGGLANAEVRELAQLLSGLSGIEARSARCGG